jgi:hypothetical protein
LKPLALAGVTVKVRVCPWAIVSDDSAFSTKVPLPVPPPVVTVVDPQPETRTMKHKDKRQMRDSRA